MASVLEAAAGQLPGVVVGAVLTSVLVQLAGRLEAKRRRVAAAAEALVAPMCEMERLLRAWRYREIRAHEVDEILVGWDRAWLSAEDVLPDGWRHLDRDVRQAVGNSLGGEAAFAADAGLDDGWRPDRFEYHWWDVSLTYLEHVRSRLQRLTLAGRASDRDRPGYYHEWRRTEDAAVHERARARAQGAG